MQDKIISYFAINKIHVEILQVTESLQLTTYYLKIADITPSLLSKIEKMQKSICLYLQNDNIKISFDFSKGCLVLEIPKEQRQIFEYNELVKDSFIKKDGLYCNIGINTENQIKNINLCDLPHLLIAGTTGSGKSVLVNTIIMQLLENYTPKELELVLLDVKKVEFSIYKNIPHLLYDPITTLEESRKILENTIEDMTARYEKLKNANCRNIVEYNSKNDVKIKYKLIIIDELAELLLLEKNKLKADLEDYERIEKYICRIAQLGRAAGIHLIVATQRPSSDVISGLIKSNIPSKIALTVSNKINSKIILDEAGAEELTGKGDYLLKIIGSNKMERLQSAFINDTELLQRIETIKNKYDYNNKILNINKRNVTKELENYFNEVMTKTNNKTITLQRLNQKEYIDRIIKLISKDQKEIDILNKNYFETLKNVEQYYKGYIKQEKEQKKIDERNAKIKAADRLGTLYMINKTIKGINKIL